MTRLPPSLALADANGRLLITKLDGRIVIVLPPLPEADEAEWIERVAKALTAAGVGYLVRHSKN